MSKTIFKTNRSPLLSRKNLIISVDTHYDPSDNSALIIEFTDGGERKHIELFGERVEKFMWAIDEAVNELMGGA